MAQSDIAQDTKKTRDSCEHVEKTVLVDHHKKAEAFITLENLPPLDPAVEKSLNRKLDIWIMPLLTLNFMFAFIDRYALFSHCDDLLGRSVTLCGSISLIPNLSLTIRANLGNTKIIGLEKDLGMQGYDFNWASTAFVSPRGH